MSPLFKKPKAGWWKGIATILTLSVVAGLLYFYVNREAASPQTSEEVPLTKEHPPQPIRVASATQETIRAWVFAEGTARSVQREYLTFDRAGRVTFVKKREDGEDLRTGEEVTKGTVLARLDVRQYESEIDSAEANVAEAKAQLNVAQSDITKAQTQYDLANAQLRRAKQLRNNQAISDAEFEEAEATLKDAEAGQTAANVKLQALEASVKAAQAKLRQAELTLDEIEIVSPIDGIIAYLNIEEGFYFTQNNIRTTSESEALQTIPVVVIDPRHYEITVDVPAYQANRLQVNQEVLIIPGDMSATAAFEGVVKPEEVNSKEVIDTWKVRGTVFSINPAVNPGGRSVQMKIRTTSGAEQLKDGMFVACWIQVENKENATVAPFDAFLYEENRPYVFVIDPQQPTEEEPEKHDLGIVRRVDVPVGIESLTNREIIAGVNPGKLLATDGRYRLVDGAPVRIVNSEILTQARK
ncbi:Hypothetical protein PBC10988_1830 [Planctomycetales bacterium 10988]|nr:Hypothetical protein PBC10988_1830 [Planctomycetales bacterium 10988]